MSIRSGFHWFAAALVCVTTACSSPTEPGGTFRTEVTLRPGQVTAVASTSVRIGFDRVAAHCAARATALWHPVR